ncbi:nickel/cobalt efflux system [Aureimonas sp. SA4125]|uniref:nickel/cobalt transporter n=1 Tax=Aureimonas sp. SA4125 TaxID=2826993 RepID=UPI001CC7D433|nr:nickel/cobalt transporter [Aureimonas sp. SA4125]BDA86051.1 nickel/cobalt efflux system [Aureimonas sp. SA4125]
MQLTHPPLGRLAVLALLAGLVLMAAVDPGLAKSSLGIGTAETVSQPSGLFSGLFIEINAYQREFFAALRAALVGMKNGSGGVFFLIGLSFAYGVFHAAGPGHGKAVISSYVLANEVQLRRGIALSFVSALLQAVTALVVVGAGWFVLRGTGVSMTDATNGLEIASFVLIIAFGCWLLLRKILRLVERSRRPALPSPNPVASSFGMGTSATGLAFAGGVPAAARPGPTRLRGAEMPVVAPGGPIMRPASGGFSSEVCVDDAEDCDCGRAHMPDPRALGATRLSLGSAASAVFAVGLRPCTGAIVVLTFALLNGLYLGGVLSVLAMALGTAITVSAIAALAVFAKDVALRFGAAGGRRAAVLDSVEVIGALLVIALGVALLGGALA